MPNIRHSMYMLGSMCEKVRDMNRNGSGLDNCKDASVKRDHVLGSKQSYQIIYYSLTFAIE